MGSTVVINNISEALALRTFPSVTVWNRLEGRPRTIKFDRALRAEVRDALWMLSRQWQMGEFEGDDAGSPVKAKVRMATTRLTKLQPDAAATEAFASGIPLEAQIERRPIRLRLGGQKVAFDLRLLMGRQWLKLIHGTGDYRAAFLAKYPIDLPDPKRKEDAPWAAHPETWALLAAVAGRAMDGGELYLHLTADPGHHAYDGITALDADKPTLDALAARFVAWFDRLLCQPSNGDNPAWIPSRLEYQLACSAPQPAGEKVFRAEEYYHGHLDWYNFDIDRGAPGLGAVANEDRTGAPAAQTQTLIPVPVSFEGMPNTRWWSFEDGQTNFGDIDAATTDIAKLLFIEFGLIYANDWFVIPFTLPSGSIATVQGLAVTNVFGERLWIEPAGCGLDDDWQRWTMFTVNIKGNSRDPADLSLLLLPTVPKIQESAPVEEVLLIRDEMANMVWGVEKTVPLAGGGSKPGSEAGVETHRYYERLLPGASGPVPPAGAEFKANVRYKVMTSVPENWIPFIPVHVDGSNRQIQLQRASMPRILPNAAAEPVRPRTTLLRTGLDQDPPAPYYLHEEEVTRAGVRVTQCFRRTRWRDGQVLVWLGVRKQTGRGSGSSGLAFDQLIDKPK